MNKLILVIGLPGSGKSHYLRQLKEDEQIDEYYDDYQKDAFGESPNPYLSKNYGELLARLINEETVAIADIQYCEQDKLDAVLESIKHVLPNIEYDLRYFENNPEKAIANILHRDRDQRVDNEITFIKDNFATL